MRDDLTACASPGANTVLWRVAGALLMAAVPSVSQGQLPPDCPPAEQPALSNVLGQMIKAERGDDVMQCIIAIDDREKEASSGYSDDVRYQLAKQSSDAIASLGDGGVVFPAYHAHAARLWRSYLEKASPPFDKTRLPFGITKLMQHARFSSFPDFVPGIATAMSRGRAWVTPGQADQLFSTVKRCPKWRNTTDSRSISCAAPCPDTGRTLLSKLRAEFGSEGWGASDGARRLAMNAKAFEGGLTCKR